MRRAREEGGREVVVRFRFRLRLGRMFLFSFGSDKATNDERRVTGDDE